MDARISLRESSYSAMGLPPKRSDSGLRKSVRKGPGSTIVTEIPNGETSFANDSENPSSANLLAQYSDAICAPTRPAIDDTLKMTPFRAERMNGRAAQVTWNTPNKFVSNCSCASLIVISSKNPMWPQPALFTNTSIPPKAANGGTHRGVRLHAIGHV